MSKAKDFFTLAEGESIVDAIKAAELNTSGEIRVHLEEKAGKDAYDRAKQVFDKLKMHQTEQRNGVLFYLATQDKKFAILGDKGIDDVVPEDFWNSTRDLMQEHFRNGRFVEGLTEGIASAGEQLKKYFPYQSDDVNELDDEISYQ